MTGENLCNNNSTGVINEYKTLVKISREGLSFFLVLPIN